MQQNLFGLTVSQLTDLCKEIGEPAYRAQQLAQWIYHSQVTDFDAMTNLPALLRQKLKQTAIIRRLQVIDSQQAKDGTRKFLFGLWDKANIESVYLPYHDRHSVCVSTQVGCAAGCHFCATGQSGFLRNLTCGEIIDQVLSIQQITGERISHVVYMGMGEPLWNLPAVLASIELLNA